MKKIAVIALSLSLASSAAFAHVDVNVGDHKHDDSPAALISGGSTVPGVVIAGGVGVGTGGIILGALGLLLLAGLFGSANTTPGT